MSARKSISNTASAEGCIVSTIADKLIEDQLTRPGSPEDNSAKVALTRLAPSNSSRGLRELARELGRVAAQAEMRRARRGSVAILDHWIVALLGIFLALVAIWTFIER